MTKEEAKAEIRKVFEPAFANYIITALTEGATPSERKTDTCTNAGKDYAECDQFVCSKCGIEIQDWHRVERDMDDGEVSYHEYTFRFCPHCGAKMEGSEE